MYVLYEIVVLTTEAQIHNHNAKRSAKLKSKLTVKRLNKEIIRTIKTFRRITCKILKCIMSIVRRPPRLFYGTTLL